MFITALKENREVVDHAIIKTLLMISGGLAKIERKRKKNDSVWQKHKIKK